MEKPTIYSSAPKPPKQIRVVENPVEPIIEKQDLPEKKEETPSTITVMQPTVSKNNTVVKLNSEKQEPSELPKVEAEVSVENELPKKDEIINASPQADIETATDFTDNKQIVTVEEPFEEPSTTNDLNADAKVEVASKENKESTATEEPEATDIEAKTNAESIVETKESEETASVKTPEITDVDAKAAAESSIEPKDNEETATIEKPEITNVEVKANEETAIETKEEEPETLKNIGVDSDKENVSLVTDEDVASIAPSIVEQGAYIESIAEPNTDVQTDITPELATEPEVEFVTIAEQYLQNDVVEEVKAATETKALPEKTSKSSGSSKNKVDAEYDFENLKIPGDDELFQRQYYTMGEVATMFHANQSQIRFWENEFDILQPKKNKKGDRYFRPEDVKNLQVIHHLLRNRRFTIEGAREYLKSNKQRTQDTVSAIASLSQLKSFLIELKANL